MNAESLNDDVLEELLCIYGVVGDPELHQRIRDYVSLLLLWNRKLSLTAITDPVQIIRLHFGESFFTARTAGIEQGRLADIGAGAGFPGIPIRMVANSIELTLIEPSAKKTAFLHEVVRKITLSGVRIIRNRMEDASDISEGLSFDFIVSRALGKYEELLAWSNLQLSVNGKAVLLLGEREAEKLREYHGWKWQDPVKIPDSEARFVLIGRPRRA